MSVFRWFVLAYCVWQANDLWGTWQGNSPESWGWLMFGLWLVPALRAAIRDASHNRPQEQLLGAAMVLALVGQMTWLNCLQHFALALAIAGWRQPWPGQRVWLAASVLWMPACGWLVDGTAAGWETALRLGGLAAIAVGLPGFRQRPYRVAWTFALLLLTSTVTRADTFTYSPIQSAARPFNLKIVDQVALAGSDAASADFSKNTLPTMQRLIDQNLSERVAITDRGQMGSLIALDPNALRLSVAADVRVYFVGEGAAYHNSLGFNTGGGGIDTGDPLLIFPDASSPVTYLSSGAEPRTRSTPLFPGDFVELGSFDAGTQLDFFLIANGANGGRNIFSTDSRVNSDGIDHVVAFAQVQSPYVLIGFEDMVGGGDRDYNDLLFAVYFGEQNVNTLIRTAALHGVPAPEPGFLWLIVAAFSGWLIRTRRRLALSRQGR
ncbi:MAG: DUF4114 domain-containing protein [Pirellulaceae bacterium]|nr:DUF4114 domain-containing protein [Pirellulaceae bacterium]